MEHLCLACRRTFPTQRSLSGHIAHCLQPNQALKLSDILHRTRKRHTSENAAKESKRARVDEEVERDDEGWATDHGGMEADGDIDVDQFEDVAGTAMHLTHMPPTIQQQCAGILSDRNIASGHSAMAPSSQPSSLPPNLPDPPPLLTPFETQLDTFSLYSIYPTRPTLAPEADHTLEGVTDAPTLEGLCATLREVCLGVSAEISDDDLFGAFTNPSSALLMTWHYSGSNASSAAGLNCLAEFLCDPCFNSADLVGFSHAREIKRLDDYLEHKSNPFCEEYGWQQSTVKIRLSNERAKFPSEDDAPQLEIPGIYHHSLTDIITQTFEDDVSTSFNMTPFRQYWNAPDNRTLEVFSESYASPEMIKAYEEVNAIPRDPGDDLEHVVASLMLPDDLQEIYIDIFGEPTSSSTYTHLKRELIHAIWELILDGKFMEAYKHGIVIRCNYPEKILLASIKFLGQCPCPRCLVKKSDIHMMGMMLDMRRRVTRERIDDLRCQQRVEDARKLIFQLGAPVDGSRVKAILNEESYVPIRNAFSQRLLNYGINMFALFVVDQLHEFEIGAWKAIFTHLMRILHAAGGTAVQRLNERYRMVPTFGRGTIRRFHYNASSMKKLAARDFEDLLQCAIPAFENLLPEPHNAIILDLLFDLASWHGYAKLQMHTTDTLALFNTATAVLGQLVRKFYKTMCDHYHTTELPHEHAAQGCQEVALAAKQQGTSTTPSQKSSAGPKHKSLNLSTYKFHALGDYADTIKRMGTTDNYSTQPWLKKLSASHYHISKYAKCSYDIFAWLGKLDNDAAIDNFIPRLKDHLLARLRSLDYSGDEHSFSDDDRNQVTFTNNQLHEHSVLRVNYTTYDLRREQDSINPQTHADIMMLSHEDDDDRHPYWYARVIKIFHLDVWYDGQGAMQAPTCMHVLFVRWFGRNIDFKAGWSAKRLHCIGFFKQDDPSEGFGFIDPDHVIRGVHLIPGYQHGRTDTQLGPSFVRPAEDDNKDFSCFYVNHFVDRDMFMRFRGGGVGHKVTWEWDEFLRNDGTAASQDEEVIELREVVDEVVDDNDSEGSASEDLGDEGNPVQVGADGEDDEFLAQEGYGAL
ncbi:hypothetical protein DFH29DRAFT_998600 [Suillus ampliporus]|nr:hypothetical protein DFH29DRAFT_998600 [Suillus ampliporus]